MRAAWYDRQGPAADVLHVGELPDPVPGPGEVRVRVRLSAVSPGETKKRRGWLGSSMPYPRVVPHRDAAGVIDQVGAGVDPARIGRRVWTYRAQSYRAFGAAAQYTVVPGGQAVDLPDQGDDETGASLGIPGITAHRAVFGDGPVTGRTVLVHGVLGAVGGVAAQLAVWGGATVIGTVRGAADLASVPHVVGAAVTLDGPDPAAAVREHAPDGVDRIVEVAFSDNVDLDAAVVAKKAVIAAYGTREERPRLPFWPMLFDTSPSGCSAATTFRPRPSSRPHVTWFRPRSLGRCGSRPLRPCPSPASPAPTNGSTLAKEDACSSRRNLNPRHGPSVHLADTDSCHSERSIAVQTQEHPCARRCRGASSVRRRESWRCR